MGEIFLELGLLGEQEAILGGVSTHLLLVVIMRIGIWSTGSLRERSFWVY
jgi:hypothetical protein